MRLALPLLLAASCARFWAPAPHYPPPKCPDVAAEREQHRADLHVYRRLLEACETEVMLCSPSP